MTTKVYACTAFTLIGLLAGCYLLASAQDDPTKKPASDPKDNKIDVPTAGRFYGNVRPVREGPSKVSLKTADGFERLVWTDLPSEADERSYPGLRFLRPVLALVEREPAFEAGLPPVIDRLRRNLDGSVDLRFRVLVTSPAFEKKCRDAVVAQEGPSLGGRKLTQDDITVERWPLLHCVVNVRDALNKEVLGVTQTDTLSATGDDFTITFRFSADEFLRVLDLIRSGDLDFVYSYTYANTQVQTGKVDLKGVKNAKLLANQKLQSKQEKDPIFQAEANEAVRHVLMSVERSVRATHKDLLPLLTQQGQSEALFQKLFADDGVINPAELKKGDERTAEMIAAYLKPQLEQVRESLGDEKMKMTIDQKNVGKEETVQAKGGLDVGFISFGGGMDEKTRTDLLKRLEEATGSKWEKETEIQKYRPHAIKKFRYQSGADQVVIDDTFTVFLQVGPEQGYLEDSPVPVTFTNKTANLDGPPRDAGPYQGVPVGAVLPYFGTTLPKGYRWCYGTDDEKDPENVFPRAAWVPKDLWGEPLPDMREQLIGGAKDEKQVGQIWKSGVVITPAQTVDGTKFTLPELKLKKVTGLDVKPKLTAKTPEEKKDPGEISVYGITPAFIPGDVTNYTGDNDFPIGGWPGGASYHVRHAVYRGYEGTETMKGEQVLPSQSLPLSEASTNPRHVMCRWIIRVE